MRFRFDAANRRFRVGLCDRLVANRYLLFGLFGALQTLACVMDLFVVRDLAAPSRASAGSDEIFQRLDGK